MIQLQERVPSIWPLSTSDLTYLLSFVHRGPEEGDEAKVIQSITPTRRPGYWQITAGDFVGRLGLPSGEWIDFQSRFDFPDPIRLIQLGTWPPRLLNRYPTPARAGLKFVDAIALAFAREVGRLVGQGLSKGYREERQSRPPYGGRIDVGFHLSRFAGRPDVLVTKRRRLTVDIEINQALGAALEVLYRVPLASEVGRTVAQLRPTFAQVSRSALSAGDVARLPLRGESVRYRHALLLAEVILRSRDLVPTAEGLSGVSFLFFMPKIWERYVARWVAETSRNETAEPSYAFRLTTEGRTAEADVVIRSRNQVSALFDAKYKTHDSAPSSADIYQMVTYCEALGLSEAQLVYPGTFPSRKVTVKDKTIHIRGLALDLSDVETAAAAA